jgi:hypothetical protein
VGDLLDHIRAIEPDQPRFAQQFRALKGLFFVHLYAAFEFTVGSTVDRMLAAIRGDSVTIKQLKPELLALELDGRFKAVVDTYGIPHWEKRWELLTKIDSNDATTVSISALGAVLMNPNPKVLETIWRLFCVSDVLFKEGRWKGRIQELVENRNKVSHGRESATDVGGSFSVDDLRLRYDDVSEFCSHFTDSLTACVNAARHIR